MNPRPDQFKYALQRALAVWHKTSQCVCVCVCVYDEPHSPSGSYLNKFTLRFNAIKAFGGLAGNAAVAIDVPLHMYNMPQTPFDMQNKIVHNDFNKYSQHTKTNTNIQMPRSDNNIGNGHRR